MKYIIAKQTNIQFFEPHNHCVNTAEPAIKSLKYHALVAFTTLDPNCTIQLWDQFTEQIEITLNLLRISRRNKNKSTYWQYHNFHNKKWLVQTPLALCGSPTPERRQAPFAFILRTVKRQPSPRVIGLSWRRQIWLTYLKKNNRNQLESGTNM